MRVLTCHSAQERCGIRQYGEQLDRSIKSLVEVRAFNFQSLLPVTEIKCGDVALVHFEPVLVGDKRRFSDWLRLARQRGAKVVFCCHYYDAKVEQEFSSLVDRFVLHRPYGVPPKKAVEIPLACPVFTPSSSREELRRKFCLPEDGLVLTTVGFLTRWKRTPDVVRCLLEQSADSVHLCVQTPWPYDLKGSYAQAEETHLRTIVKRFEGRVTFSTTFLPEQELLELAYASDLGFVFHGYDTGSVSAATKQFVSARCPLVVTESTHASDMRLGVRRVAGFEPGVFAREVARVASDDVWRLRLQEDIVEEYARINMDVVAARYVEEFKKL